MPVATQSATVSLAIAIGVAGIALLLGFGQWQERRRRAPDLPAVDASHFTRQDLRRGLGVFIMLLLAVGLPAGARVPPQVARRTNPLFIQVWGGVLLLILILLCLAMLDWLATRLYARRHRRAMVRERIEILREEFKLMKNPDPGDGPPDHSGLGNGVA